VVHADRARGFRPASESMANIRFTLRTMRRGRLLTREDERALVAAMKARHFSERSRATLAASAQAVLGGRAERAMADFHSRYVDVKRLDARLLCARLLDPGPPRRNFRRPPFPKTTHWIAQFEDALQDVPPLPPGP
jgi:hypothetical protein